MRVDFNYHLNLFPIYTSQKQFEIRRTCDYIYKQQNFIQAEFAAN